MKSKIFSKKRNYFADMKGHFWVPSVIAFVYFVIFCIMTFLMISSAQKNRFWNFSYHMYWENELMILGMAAAMFSGMINAFDGYLYLYSKKKVDFFHSLPVKRSEFFWKKTAYAGLSFVIPYLVMETLAIILGALRGFYFKGNLLIAGKMFLVHLIVYFLIYFSFVLVISMTGNYLMGILSMFGFSFYGVFSALMIPTLKEEFYHTYLSRYAFESKIMFWVSPVTASVEMTTDVIEGKYSSLLGVLAAILILAVLSYLAYTRRPSEKTGNSLVYAWSEYVIALLLGVLGGIISGFVFYAISSKDVRVAWGIFGIIFGTVLVHGVTQIIFRMDFTCFIKKKILCVLTTIVTIGIGMVLYLDLPGFDKRIPDYDKIETICIMNQFSGHNPIVTESGNILREYDSEFLDYCEAGKSTQLYKKLEDLSENQDEDPERWSLYYVCYKMTSGQKIYRQYKAPIEQDEKEIDTYIYEYKKQKELIYDCLKKIDRADLESIQYVHQDEYMWDFSKDEKSVTELIDAICMDIEEASTETLLEDTQDSIVFNYWNQENEMIFTAEIKLHPEFTHVMEFLESVES